MSSSVARHRYNQKIVIQRDRLVSFQQLFRLNATRIGAMDDPPAAEVFAEFFMVGDVIAVRKEHDRNAAEFLQPLYECSRKSR